MFISASNEFHIKISIDGFKDGSSRHQSPPVNGSLLHRQSNGQLIPSVIIIFYYFIYLLLLFFYYFIFIYLILFIYF